MTKAELVQKWLEMTRSNSLATLSEDLRKSLRKQFPDEGFRKKIDRATELLDQSQVTEIWSIFAEEHFSQDALEAGIAFFESDLGKKYLDERQKVSKAAMDRLSRHIAECTTRAFSEDF